MAAPPIPTARRPKRFHLYALGAGLVWGLVRFEFIWSGDTGLVGPLSGVLVGYTVVFSWLRFNHIERGKAQDTDNLDSEFRSGDRSRTNR